MAVNKIMQYLQSDSRNKLVFLKEKPADIPCLDIGSSFAQELNQLGNNKHIGFVAEKILNDLMTQAVSFTEPFGNVQCIENLGILFEPELKLNFLLFLDKYSKDIPLFVHWDGQIENNTLYFLTKERGIIIDIQELSHITL